MIFTTQRKLVELAEKDMYWHPWNIRWEYMLVTMAWLQDIQPTTILEAGTNGLTVCEDSDTIGLGKADTIHDLRCTPWPFEDKQYDVFIALQVWEHLTYKQESAFTEASRIAKHIIMSFPYMWDYANGHCHNGIDEDTINEWAGSQPDKALLVNDSYTRSRLVCYWNKT